MCVYVMYIYIDIKEGVYNSYIRINSYIIHIYIDIYVCMYMYHVYLYIKKRRSL